MDLISILATVILVTTIGTMVVGVGAYMAFKLRDKRRPTGKKIDDTMDHGRSPEPVFLKRYIAEPVGLPPPAGG
jgi:heme/copper-type cytochrome/quinol oxidase subunit 2